MDSKVVELTIWGAVYHATVIGSETDIGPDDSDVGYYYPKHVVCFPTRADRNCKGPYWIGLLCELYEVWSKEGFDGFKKRVDKETVVVTNQNDKELPMWYYACMLTLSASFTIGNVENSLNATRMYDLITSANEKEKEEPEKKKQKLSCFNCAKTVKTGKTWGGHTFCNDDCLQSYIGACPTCGNKFEYICKCAKGERVCPSKHKWYILNETKVLGSC